MATNRTRGSRGTRRQWAWLVAAALLVVFLATQRDEGAQPSRDAADTAGSPRPVLRVTDQKDGDSWEASDGVEYRLGLVNAPEHDEPCGPEAEAFTRGFLSDGFTADDYATDTYGRHVAEVFDVAGTSLNVALVESGLADDRFVDRFRSENPDLAERVEQAAVVASEPTCRR